MRTNTTAIVLACVILAGCGRDHIRIGVWGGPTGAHVGQMIAMNVNYGGGASDHLLQARVVSQRAVVMDELDAAGLAASLDSMANDPLVTAVVMRMTDSVTEKAAQKFEQIGMPYLITTPVPEDYAATHPHAFMLVPSVESMARFMVDEALSGNGQERIAILSVREGHAQMLAEELEKQLTARGNKPIFTSTFSPHADESNMQAKAKETETKKPTTLLWIGRSPSLAIVHPIVRNGIPNLRLISSDLGESFHVYMNPNKVYTGIRFVRYMDPMSKDSAINLTREKMSMWIGRNEMNNEAVITYDGLWTLVRGMRSGAITREALYQYLKNNPAMPGIAGNVTFGPKQRIERPMHFAEVTFNGIKTLEGVASAALR